MTTEQMVAQIKEAREAFVKYISENYKVEMNPWDEVEMYKIVGFLDCSCERMNRLDNMLKNKKNKES